jgi:hypothetical protein
MNVSYNLDEQKDFLEKGLNFRKILFIFLKILGGGPKILWPLTLISGGGPWPPPWVSPPLCTDWIISKAKEKEGYRKTYPGPCSAAFIIL